VAVVAADSVAVGLPVAAAPPAAVLRLAAPRAIPTEQMPTARSRVPRPRQQLLRPPAERLFQLQARRRELVAHRLLPVVLVVPARAAAPRVVALAALRVPIRRSN
jgi:hypothetical protein